MSLCLTSTMVEPTVNITMKLSQKSTSTLNQMMEHKRRRAPTKTQGNADRPLALQAPEFHLRVFVKSGRHFFVCSNVVGISKMVGTAKSELTSQYGQLEACISRT